MSSSDEISIQIADKRLPIIRSKAKPSGQYVYFPITNDGLHISVHPTGNPHLRDKHRQIAELDLQTLKETTIEDFKSVFSYPHYNGDVQVLPVSSSLNAWFGDVWDFPSILSKMFQDRVIYVMRARRLKEFFHAKPGNYIVMDPRNERRIIMQFQGNLMGPLNLDADKGPRNPRMKNMLSINLALAKAFDKIPDTQFEAFQPDEFTISQWGAIFKTILGQVQVVRWNKGGSERPLGTLLDRN